MDAQPESADQGGERFAYFMVRVQTNADTQARSSGIVERLGTGRKQAFSSIEELVRLLTERRGDAQNMRTGAADGNESTVTGAEARSGRPVAPNNPLGDR